MSKPLVSVVILTHNRKGVLFHCLRSVLNLDYRDIDIIIVDNMSTDGTSDAVEKEFGQAVRLIRREIDSPAAGRNEGFQQASGDFILSLDDDMVFKDRRSIQKAVALFERFPDVGVLTFKITGSETLGQPLREHWWHPMSYEVGKDHFFYTDYFSEGAVFMRGSMIRKVGAYDEDYFACFEGVDFALKAISNGYNILYAPTIACTELQVRHRAERVRCDLNYYFLRNKLWTAWKNYPLARAVAFVGPRIVRDALYSLRYGWSDLWFSAMARGVVAPEAIRAKRCPLPRSAWRRVRQIRQSRIIEVPD